MQSKRWYKLDNIGKFYASIKNTKIPKVFRYSVTLYDEVDELVLQEALDKTVEVYPNFNVNLKKGLFWNYLNETNKKNRVEKENIPVEDGIDFLEILKITDPEIFRLKI